MRTLCSRSTRQIPTKLRLRRERPRRVPSRPQGPSTCPISVYVHPPLVQSISARTHDLTIPRPIQLVFVSSAFGQPGSLDTFSVQLLSLLSIQYQQPYFGSNHIALDIKPAPGGGLTEGAKAELRLRDKGIFELSGVLEKSREKALYKKRDEMLNQPELREYIYLLSCSLI